MRIIALFTFGILLAGGSFAADIYVDNVAGNNRHDGLSKTVVSAANGPLRSIEKAIALSQPGDTIHLNPTGKVYRQMAAFHDKGGEPGKPITLDGHNVTLTGADPIPPGKWEPWRDGVWICEDTISRNLLIVDGEAILDHHARDKMKTGQFYFEYAWNGKPAFYFMPPKGRKASDMVVEVGQPDGATVLDPKLWRGGRVSRREDLRWPSWVTVDGKPATLVTTKEYLTPGMWCREEKAVYFHPPEGKDPNAMAIENVTRACGVALSGAMSHVVIRNLTARHVWNDGYNIHGKVTAAEFYNCNAHHCYDEGFSAHDKCETLLDGAVYDHCWNGIFNVNVSGYSITRNVIISNSRTTGFGTAFTDRRESTERHELYNVILIDNPRQLVGRNLKADNVLIVATSDKARKDYPAVTCIGPVDLKRVTVAGHMKQLSVVRGKERIAVVDSRFDAVKLVWSVPPKYPPSALFFQNLWFVTTFPADESSQKLERWFHSLGESSAACRFMDLTGYDALLQGSVPGKVPANGCTSELRRACDEYLKRVRE